jgi:hypothetical protein
MRRRWGLFIGALLMLAATVAVRLPGFASSRHIDFDEGVYGVSVLAMRDGFLPFREVFSSQGPLFLPLLGLFDLIGLRQFRAVRLGMLLTAVLFTVGVYLIARRATGDGGMFPSLVAAAVVGTSAAGVAAAGPIHSDGIALAFGVWALVALLAGDRLGRWQPLVVGLLVGAGMAVKSGFLLPVAVAVAWWFGRRGEWKRLGIAALSAAALGLAVTLPWGLGNVWDQFVAFQLEAPRDRVPWPNVRDSIGRLWGRDAIFLLFGGVGLATLLVRLVRRRWPPGDRSVQWAVVVWLVATLAFLILGTELERGSYRFLVFAIAPAMVAYAIVRPPHLVTALALGVAVLLVPLHIDGADRFLKVQRLNSTPAAIVAELERLPEEALVISDDPGLAWVAGRRPPPDLVDTSWARIVSGNLTANDIIAGAAEDGVCAVLFSSGRFDRLGPSLPRRLAGYELAMEWVDRHRLYVREGCAG